MTIWQFENRDKADLVVTVNPCGREFTVRHLATLGIRSNGNAPLIHVSVGQSRLSLWLEDEFETDLVEATPYELLKLAICVDLGWCGSIRDGKSSDVDDLLPPSGTVTARQFAELVMHAESGMSSAADQEDQLSNIARYFEDHLGTATIGVDKLRDQNRRPFEDT